MTPDGADWPRPFRRALAVLIGVLCLAAIVVGVASLVAERTVRTQGIATEATALGTTMAAGATQIYVRFLVGDSAVVTVAESPEWTPPHGTRIKVAYLAEDPAGSVRIVDSRAGGGYRLAVAGIVAGTGGAALLVLALRRAATPAPDHKGEHQRDSRNFG